MLFFFLALQVSRVQAVIAGADKIQRDTELITVKNETGGNNYRFVLTYKFTIEHTLYKQLDCIK